MTQQRKHVDGVGGAYVVGADAIVQKECALNPGDPGYAEAVAKAAAEGKNRVLSHADLVEHPEGKAKHPKAEKAVEPQASASAAAPKGGNR